MTQADYMFKYIFYCTHIMQRFGHIFLKILKNETPNNVPPFVPVPCS